MGFLRNVIFENKSDESGGHAEAELFINDFMI